MRVRILTHYYPPEVGAPQMRLAALASGLAAGGADVTVHTCSPHYPDGAIKPPYCNRPLSVEVDGDFRIVRSWVHAAPNRGLVRRLANHASFAASALATSAAGGAADVVLAETPPLLLAGAAVPYAHAKRANLVLNVADLWPDSAVEMGALSSQRAIRAARYIERTAYRSASMIACPTNGIVAKLDAHPAARGKSVLIRPAVDLERFNPSERTQRNDDSGHPLRVLYAGTIGLAHGLDTLVDAFGEIGRRPDAPAMEATIAGDGAEAPRLRTRLASTGLTGNSPTSSVSVKMIGTVPAELVPSLYAECDVAVVMLRDLPVFEGALPTKMLEAMAAGRPVILAARGEAAHVIESEGAGLVVPPEDPLALAHALVSLAVDPDRRRKLGAAGRLAVEREFDREAWLSRWHDLLEEAAGL